GRQRLQLQFARAGLFAADLLPPAQQLLDLALQLPLLDLLTPPGVAAHSSRRGFQGRRANPSARTATLRLRASRRARTSAANVFAPTATLRPPAPMPRGARSSQYIMKLLDYVTCLWYESGMSPECARKGGPPMVGNSRRPAPAPAGDLYPFFN